jgi:hypothetical protein
MNKTLETTRYDLILGSRRLSNYFWVIISLIGGASFFTVGICSYFKVNLEPFINTQFITFLPQGILMTFYGFIGILFSMFLLLSVLFDIGGGYNKYDLSKRKIEMFRLGFPFVLRELLLTYDFKDIKSIKLVIKEGLNPKREIYLRTKDQKEIPLTRVGEPLLLSQIEEEAIDLSLFLNIPLED